MDYSPQLRSPVARQALIWTPKIALKHSTRSLQAGLQFLVMKKAIAATRQTVKRKTYFDQVSVALVRKIAKGESGTPQRLGPLRRGGNPGKPGAA